MKYRLLGKSGLRVSEALLGTMTFGDEWGWGSPKAEAQKVYETYREAGGNFIDTANFYTNGTSEKFVARKVSQLQDNLASLDLALSAEQLKSLDGASRIEPGFPQSIYDREMVRAIRYGGMWDRLLLDDSSRIGRLQGGGCPNMDEASQNRAMRSARQSGVSGVTPS